MGSAGDGTAGEGVLVALNLSQPRLGEPMIRAELAYVLPDAPPRFLLSVPGAAVISLAVTGETALAILRTGWAVATRWRSGCRA